MFNVSDPFSHLSGSAPKINNSFGHSDSLFFQPHIISPGLADTLSMSPDLRFVALHCNFILAYVPSVSLSLFFSVTFLSIKSILSQQIISFIRSRIHSRARANTHHIHLIIPIIHHPHCSTTKTIVNYSRLPEINPIREELSSSSRGNSLFENSLHNKQYSMSPSLLNNTNLSDMRMRDEFVSQTTKHMSSPWEDQILQATKTCEAWKTEMEESNRKVNSFHIPKPRFASLHWPY